MTAEKLDNLSLLKITGDDATTFLQGQLTNDINLANKQWQYSAYCTPKGRCIALFKIWQTDDAIFALIDKSLTEPTIKRLRMYVMRSKVVIEELESHHYGAFNSQAAAQITLCFSDTQLEQLEKNSFLSQDNIHCLSFGGRFLIITDESIQPKTLDQQEKSKWLVNNIKEGLPQVTAQSSELFIPQMLNLDILNGINFKKGCYTGQEIVARMHYLGKLKQRMFVCSVNSNSSESSTNIGDKIFSDTGMKSSVGHIVNIAEESAIAVLRLDSIKTTQEKENNFHISEQTTLTVNNDQPYPLNIK